MPIPVEIDGIGTVELDDDFATMDASEQDAVIREIVAQSGRQQAPAPPEQQAPAAEPGPTAPTPRPSPDGRSVVQQLFPDVHITDWERDPDSDLGRANPDSWHNRSKAAVDIRPIPGMTFDQFVSRIEEAGYPIIEKRDEVNDPAGHATGPHWHVVIGDRPADADPEFGMAGVPTGETPLTRDPADVYPDGPAQADGPPQGPGFFDMPQSWEQVGRGLATGTGDIAEGIGDILGMVGNPLNAGINALAGTDLSTDLGQSFRETLGFPEGTGIQSEIQSGIASGLFGAGLARAGGNAAGTVVQRGLYELGRTPIRDAAAGGSAAAAAGLAEDAGLGPIGQTLAALGGGMAGYKVSGMPKAATPAARAERFASKEAQRNPYAAYDAEIVEDLAGMTRNRAVSPSDPVGRAELTAKHINNLETSYTAKIEEMLTGSELPAPRKLALKEAYVRRHSLPMEEINALRGDPYGDALADGIIKVQRLRQLTPELKTKTGFLSHTANAMDFVPGIPGIVPRGIRAVARASGDGEAARVNAAERLLAKERGYKALASLTGPSGQRESRGALWEAVNRTASAREAAAAAKAARAEERAFDRQALPIIRDKVKATAPDQWGTQEPLEVVEARKAMNRQAGRMASGMERRLDGFDDRINAPVASPKDPTARDMASFRREITDPAPDMRDTRNPVATDAQLSRRVQSRDRALAKLEGRVADWEAQLADPSTAPQQAAVDPVDRMVEQGIQGEFRALDSLANSTGMSREDATRVLQAIGEDNPDLARDAARVVAGHNTSNARMGPILRPLMRSKMEELGITPRAAADEAAPAPRASTSPREAELNAEMAEIDAIKQQRYDTDPAYAEIAGTQADPLTMRQVEINQELATLRRIDRPLQWEQGRNRYQSQANDTIEAMRRDDVIGRDTQEALGNAPVQIRDNFKTVEDAEAFIVERVMPDLEAMGATAAERQRVRAYLFEIAQAKPYQNAEAYEAGTRARPRGRPRKDDSSN